MRGGKHERDGESGVAGNDTGPLPGIFEERQELDL